MLKKFEHIWDEIPRRAVKGIFLPPGSMQPGAFSGTDDKPAFIKNLTTQPDNWYYRNNPIDYKLNMHGYRTTEFSSVDWANSVVVFGCSNVFGIGIHEEDTLASQLSKLINMPVINMGAGGTSIEFSLYNSIILRNSKPIPRAVIHIWSNIDRTTYYHKRNIINHGPWSMQRNSYMDLYSTDATHAKVHATMAQMISKQLWNDTKYYEASFFDDTSLLLKIPTVGINDRARDLMHPGKDTLAKLARQIAESIK